MYLLNDGTGIGESLRFNLVLETDAEKLAARELRIGKLTHLTKEEAEGLYDKIESKIEE